MQESAGGPSISSRRAASDHLRRRASRPGPDRREPAGATHPEVAAGNWAEPAGVFRRSKEDTHKNPMAMLKPAAASIAILLLFVAARISLLLEKCHL